MLDVSAAVWCLETMQEVLHVDVDKEFFRKYRGSNSVLLIDKFSSRKGAFLKVAKLANGGLQNIIILGGNHKWGWKRMELCLDNLVGKRFWRPKSDRFQGVLTVLDSLFLIGGIKIEGLVSPNRPIHMGRLRVKLRQRLLKRANLRRIGQKQ